MATALLTVEQLNQIEDMARFTCHSLGYSRLAAEYLKAKGYTLEACIWVLFQK